MAFRYLDYEASRTVPNVVVDGSANESTVVTLSHWPGAPTPPELLRDLSAQTAFAYLEAPSAHDPAEIVTNNHFDQDGLVSVFALAQPDVASEHRELLIDVAAAGDFGTYRDRRAARASMVIARWGADELGYEFALPRLLSLAIDPDQYRELWVDEDANLTDSERRIADGTITIEERPGLDLAIVRVPDHEPSRGGHRFAHQTFEGVHPMALHNATERARVLMLHGKRFRFVDRYETWVQYQSRPLHKRVDMRPLAGQLTARDRVTWSADSPAALTPELLHAGESSLDPEQIIGLIVSHLEA